MPLSTLLSRSLVDFEHSFDLDGKIERRNRTPDDKAGMAPAFAKDGNDEVGAPFITSVC